MWAGMVFYSCAALCENVDWPNWLFLSGMMQSPLDAPLVEWYADVRTCTNSLSGGDVRLLMTLYIKHIFAYFIMLSQLSMLYFFKIWQWWERFGFLSSVLMTCLYRDWSGFSLEIPVCDHVVNQYIICDNIIECIYILAAWGDSWCLMLLKFERLNFTLSQTLFSWDLNESLESIIMPRYLYSVTTCNFSPDMY